MRKTVISLALVFVLLLSGCRIIRIEEEPLTPLEYTIVSQEDIPEEITTLIDGRKEKEFQMTYQSGEELYLVKGFGRQMTGGYSISVEEVGVSSNAVFFKTRLLGPEEELAAGEPSYPYIVVKIPYREEPVQFK